MYLAYKGRVRGMNQKYAFIKLANGRTLFAQNGLNHRNSPNSTVLVVRTRDGGYTIIGRPK